MESLLLAAPHLSCSVLDKPDVVEMMAAGSSQSGKVKFHAGDMFDRATIPEAEVVFLKNILHNWEDKECDTILKNVHSSLPAAGGTIVIVESFVPNPGEVREDDHHAFNMDFYMMVTGHFCYTHSTCQVCMWDR